MSGDIPEPWTAEREAEVRQWYERASPEQDYLIRSHVGEFLLTLDRERAEIDRLKALIEAVESPLPDAAMSVEQAEFRARVIDTIDSAIGSRAMLLDRLNVAYEALRQYAQPKHPYDGGQRARAALNYIGDVANDG